MKRVAAYLIAAALFMTACGTAPATYRQVSMQQAMEYMQTQQDYIILDVRTQEEFESGHIPGAICIPNEVISRQTVAPLTDPEQMILVYCRSGNRSKEASQKLADLGYRNVVEFGGIRDWPGEIVMGPE